MVLGGYTALAESAWMGAAQASDVLESLRAAPVGRTWRPVLPRLPRLRLAGLLTREFSIAEATFILMASFFLSALLGAVRQVLFNAAFGAGPHGGAHVFALHFYRFRR